MTTALLIDFGSTFTKLRAVDLEKGEIIGAGQGPSTVATDITGGLTKALSDLEGRIGPLPDFKHRLACSSAAGGLGMVTVGLVKELTAEAAKQAALGAGAKLTGTFSFGLTKGDIAEVEALAPDIILLAGGTDGGNSDVILENAEKLAAASVTCPVIVPGISETPGTGLVAMHVADPEVLVVIRLPDRARVDKIGVVIKIQAAIRRPGRQ